MSFTGPIIIVNFNSAEHLARCLDSIDDHAPDASVLVIDNASTDGSERAATRRPGKVELQRNAENVGFARAVNQGLARTGGDFVMLLNPDCRVCPGAVDALMAHMRAHPRCGIAAPVIVDEDGGIQGSARGDPTMLTGLFGRSTLFTRLFPGSRLTRRNVRVDAAGRGPAAGNVDWVSGACMLARRAALAEIDGFDERYFLYWEDADLCRRMRGRGYEIAYVSGAEVVHYAGRSSRSAQALATRAFHRSAYIYYTTHVARTRIVRGIAWLLLQLRCWWKLRGLAVARESSPAR
jgi:GT2 family glycosyltransferase